MENGSGPVTWVQATETFVSKDTFNATVEALSANVCDLKKAIEGLKYAIYVGTGAIVLVSFIIANWPRVHAIMGG